jgi:4-hydroxy-tetrahydrodipicolinate synthase
MKLQGIYIPLITPFYNGALDLESYEKLVAFYLAEGVSGLIPAATTGEGPTLEDAEVRMLIEKCVEYTAGRVPVFAGVSDNNTTRLLRKVERLRDCGIEGILCAAPYYNLPGQRGIYEHFLRLAEATELKIIIYNIPYRTGRNMENHTIRRLAELPNIIGLKDSCGSLEQSMELLLNRPPHFSILTGHDTHFFTDLALGADGGILASAHLQTGGFVEICSRMQNNDHPGALARWRKLMDFIPTLFLEPNPAPVKFVLRHMGLIRSAEVRLPLTEVSASLKEKLAQTATG